MAKRATSGQSASVPAPAQPGQQADQSVSGSGVEKTSLETCFKVLAGVQEQIRFADAKAAFVFGINTLMFGFMAVNVITLKKSLALTPAPPSAWVGLVGLIVFGICAVLAVGTLIYAVISRFGALAPRSRVFFGHIAETYGKDYAKYVAEVRDMTEDDWLTEVGTQIVETSHIALIKHSAVRVAAIATIVGLASWVVAVFSTSLLS